MVVLGAVAVFHERGIPAPDCTGLAKWPILSGEKNSDQRFVLCTLFPLPSCEYLGGMGTYGAWVNGSTVCHSYPYTLSPKSVLSAQMLTPPSPPAVPYIDL
jgi:hypothetical protein